MSVSSRRTLLKGAVVLAALSMCVVSCSNYEHGWFTANGRLAEEHPDLVVHLGDYQYEYAAGGYVAPGGNVRDHVGPETVTLANYRQRYAQYKTDPDLQAAHAAAPWLAVLPVFRSTADLPAGAPSLVADAHGITSVWVGGVEVCRDGAATGAMPGNEVNSLRAVAKSPANHGRRRPPPPSR